MNKWLKFPDRMAFAVVVGSIVFLILLLGVLPHWLAAREANDLRGVTAQTARGIVAMVTISPVSQGGGGLFNAVVVKFAGRREYYAIPPRSQWRPVVTEPVTVIYRVGRRTGRIHIDDVLPDATQ